MTLYFGEPSIENTSYPCGICSKHIGKNHKLIRCNLCNKIDNQSYENIRKTGAPQSCLKCQEETFPKTNKTAILCWSFADHLSTKPLKNLDKIMYKPKQLESVVIEICTRQNNWNLLLLKYVHAKTIGICCYWNMYTPKQLESVVIEICTRQNNWNLLLLKYVHAKTIGICCYWNMYTPKQLESVVIEICTRQNNWNLLLLKYVHAKTIGICCYWNMYTPKQLESVVIEICNKYKRNNVIGCIYKHPSMELNDFNERCLDPLMEELSAKDKPVYLMGDFNIDLMKMDIDNHTFTFFDSMTSNLFVPYIIYPTRVTSTTKTLIDIIFSNSPNYKVFLGTSPYQFQITWLNF